MIISTCEQVCVYVYFMHDYQIAKANKPLDPFESMSVCVCVYMRECGHMCVCVCAQMRVYARR